MDCSIIVVAPEQVRSAEIGPLHRASLGGVSSTFKALHRWLGANDDRNTYRICAVLFLAAVATICSGGMDGAFLAHVAGGCHGEL